MLERKSIAWVVGGSLCLVLGCGRTAVFEDAEIPVATGQVGDGAVVSAGSDGGAVQESDGGDAGDGGDGGDGDAGAQDAGAIDAGPPPYDLRPDDRCPHVVWTGPFPIRYAGDTAGLPNWVTSLTMGWRLFSDDSIEFVVPTTGTFVIGLDSGVADVRVTVRDRFGPLHALRGCPDAGTDGGYFTLDQAEVAASPGSKGEFRWDAGTRVLMWISVPFWSVLEPTATYEVTVQKN